MHTKISFQLMALALLLTVVGSCKKDKTAISRIVPSDVYIEETGTTDVISTLVSTGKDSVVIIKLKAAARNAAPPGNHTVFFTVDSTKLAAYQSKYGAAALLPVQNYVMLFNDSYITGGNTTSSNPVEINILSQTKLLPLSTYVLPVVIHSVDDQKPGKLGNDQVLYIVVKTKAIDYGVPLSKTGWKIVSFSTQTANGGEAANVLDNNAITYWASTANQPMPQQMVIDMVQPYDLKAVTFQNWPLYAYGSNPTQIKIELSTSQNTWINAGTFSGGTADATVHQLLVQPITSARYIRFTVLQATLFVSVQASVGLSEIGANN